MPAMLEIGVDVWSGQPLNDKKKLYDEYGVKILLGVDPPEIPPDISREEAERLAGEFVDRFFNPGKPSMIGANSSIKSPLFYKLIYKYSRERSLSNGKAV